MELFLLLLKYWDIAAYVLVLGIIIYFLNKNNKTLEKSNANLKQDIGARLESNTIELQNLRLEITKLQGLEQKNAENIQLLRDENKQQNQCITAIKQRLAKLEK